VCLIAIAHRVDAERPLVVAANRDEAYARPTLTAQFWEDQPQILAGRDLEAGGTWLGIDRHGRFAAVTNFRELGPRPANAPSRGHLVSDFLAADESAASYARRISQQMRHYAGFNLLLRDDSGLYYLSNRTKTGDTGPRLLAPGVYGLSNHLLDTPWPKVVQAKQRFAEAISHGQALDSLMSILTDREIAAEDALPDTGIGVERERLLSPIFIASEIYGTRCSTLVEVSAEKRVRFAEQTFERGGVAADTVEYRFDLQPASVAA
jgi:uncharacterized protein with NRDE domain